MSFTNEDKRAKRITTSGAFVLTIRDVATGREQTFEMERGTLLWDRSAQVEEVGDDVVLFEHRLAPPVVGTASFFLLPYPPLCKITVADILRPPLPRWAVKKLQAMRFLRFYRGRIVKAWRLFKEATIAASHVTISTSTATISSGVTKEPIRVARPWRLSPFFAGGLVRERVVIDVGDLPQRKSIRDFANPSPDTYEFLPRERLVRGRWRDVKGTEEVEDE